MNKQAKSPDELIALKESFLCSHRVPTPPQRQAKRQTVKSTEGAYAAMANKIRAGGSVRGSQTFEIYDGLRETRLEARNPQQAIQLTEEFCRLNAEAIKESRPTVPQAALPQRSTKSRSRSLTEQEQMQNEVDGALDEIRRTSKTPAQLIQQNANFVILNSDALKQMASPSSKTKSNSSSDHE